MFYILFPKPLCQITIFMIRMDEEKELPKHMAWMLLNMRRDNTIHTFMGESKFSHFENPTG